MKTSQTMTASVLAIEEILLILYGCRCCDHLTGDDSTLVADSSVDGIDAIDTILRNHSLVPDDAAHDVTCDYSNQERGLA